MRAPLAVGVKVTWTWQLLPEETDIPEQVSAALLKSPGLFPRMEMAPMTRFKEPVLETVSVCGGLVVPIA